MIYAIRQKLLDEKQAPVFLMEVALGLMGVGVAAAVLAMLLAR